MLRDSLQEHMGFLNALSLYSNSLTRRQRKKALSHDGELLSVTSCLNDFFAKHLENLMFEARV